MKNKVYLGVRILTLVVFCILLSGCGYDGVHVAPSRLTFGKDGGSASIEVDEGEDIDALYETGADFGKGTPGKSETYAYNRRKRAYLDWLEVVRVSDGHYSVEAKPNDSGKERYAKIIFGIYDECGSAKITQKAE